MLYNPKLHREHGHGLSVGLNPAVNDEEMPDAKEQHPPRHEEEVYPLVAPGVLPELDCNPFIIRAACDVFRLRCWAMHAYFCVNNRQDMMEEARVETSTSKAERR